MFPLPWNSHCSRLGFCGYTADICTSPPCRPRMVGCCMVGGYWGTTAPYAWFLQAGRQAGAGQDMGGAKDVDRPCGALVW